MFDLSDVSVTDSKSIISLSEYAFMEDLLFIYIYINEIPVLNTMIKNLIDSSSVFSLLCET